MRETRKHVVCFTRPFIKGLATFDRTFCSVHTRVKETVHPISLYPSALALKGNECCLDLIWPEVDVIPHNSICL